MSMLPLCRDVVISLLVRHSAQKEQTRGVDFILPSLTATVFPCLMKYCCAMHYTDIVKGDILPWVLQTVNYSLSDSYSGDESTYKSII